MPICPNMPEIFATREWGSSMQLLLAAKLYKLVLFQPNDTPRFVPFLVDKNIETGAMESPVGWIRHQANHFDVAKFKMKENV
uniref:Uncharacterized protein n=1 Tax=Ditylenchus dipsaci TaxID=166011 RepID=A0A915CP63_9BILA